ncbi:MAG TPA: hypothetical protein VLB74_12505 [Flavobacterium sp.]|uniref:hypothetical protein n=1 Tax=Flavobacterium sp. TaxID=239 RepID=UPI002BEC29B8|nr:hypothetical protein [Flavobacterium sp.]HSD15463.1 hypothetical protein [Flavobacterium sp.]
MRNYFKIFAITVSSIALFSCENDDDTNFVQPNYLAGKWIPVEIGTVDSNNIMLYTPYENDAQCDLDNLLLNGDYSFSNTDFRYNGTTCDSDVTEGTYRKDGKMLVLTTTEEIDGVPTEVEKSQTLVSLTYDTMEISFTDEDTHELTFVKFSKSE